MKRLRGLDTEKGAGDSLFLDFWRELWGNSSDWIYTSTRQEV